MNTNRITHSVRLALVMIAVSLALTWAGKAHLVDGDLPTRISMALSGLVIAFYGNDIPKVLLRSARARSAKRVSGWAFTLSGLSTAVLWTLAPLDMALTFTLGIVGTTVVLVLLYCLIARTNT